MLELVHLDNTLRFGSALIPVICVSHPYTKLKGNKKRQTTTYSVVQFSISGMYFLPKLKHGNPVKLMFLSK